jgi:hypothetical protein
MKTSRRAMWAWHERNLLDGEQKNLLDGEQKKVCSRREGSWWLRALLRPLPGPGRGPHGRRRPDLRRADRGDREGREAAGQDPAGRLVAGCEAYVAFGLEHPARYGVLFSRQLPTAPDYCKPVPIGPDGRPVLEFGAESFALLVQAIEDCVTAGVSASTDVVADATAAWVALHGTVSLRAALPRFPWPDSAASVRQLVLSLAQVTA